MKNMKAGKTIWIARHGNRADFVDPTWRLRAARPHDPPLSPDGVEQARKLGRRLKGEPIRHIFASPFLRTLETASAVAAELKVPVKIEHGAGEFLNPEWFSCAPEFLSGADLHGRFPQLDASYASRGASRYPELDEELHCWPRAGETARKIAQEFDGDLLFVCHGATLLGLSYGLVAGRPPIHCGLTSLVKIVWNGTEWEMALNGDTSHLD